MDTILHGANLSLTNLHHAQLVQTNLVDATLTDCSIYGISAWDVKLSEGTKHIPAILGVGVPTGGDAYSGVSSLNSVSPTRTLTCGCDWMLRTQLALSRSATR
jgi:hypothetical protein